MEHKTHALDVAGMKPGCRTATATGAVDKQTLVILDRLAREQGVSRSQIVKHAIDQYVQGVKGSITDQGDRKS